jgi:pyruvate formate lyase activating enzyme
MERCHQIAKAEGINFAYLGNVAGHPAENTYCPGCQELVIRRVGMGVEAVHLTGGQCPKCKRAIPGVWS